jgi:hypothetical protein
MQKNKMFAMREFSFVLGLVVMSFEQLDLGK